MTFLHHSKVKVKDLNIAPIILYHFPTIQFPPVALLLLNIECSPPGPLHLLSSLPGRLYLHMTIWLFFLIFFRSLPNYELSKRSQISRPHIKEFQPPITYHLLILPCFIFLHNTYHTSDDCHICFMSLLCYLASSQHSINIS